VLRHKGDMYLVDHQTVLVELQHK